MALTAMHWSRPLETPSGSSVITDSSALTSSVRSSTFVCRSRTFRRISSSVSSTFMCIPSQGPEALSHGDELQFTL